MIRAIRGRLLNPQPDGTVTYHAQGALVADAFGKIVWMGDVATVPAAYREQLASAEPATGIILPPFLDLHTHLPQHPIKGRFTAGIEDDPPEGRLLAGLNRNVFPAEARCSDDDYAAQVIAAFAADTLRHGVVGGAAYGTVHASAADAALRALPDFWSLGMVLMNFNCPEYLRTDEDALEDDIAALVDAHGKRVIVTDRFAVSVTTPLRRRAVAAAHRHGLRMQTHLNEQRTEKALVEQVLYPDYDSYTDVYRRDGLLAHHPILAHCIQMTAPEWQMLADSSAVVAHCPTSNTLLGSGILPLDQLPRTVPYAICTDVGASPTCSLLAEMAQFLQVHAGRSRRATPEEALYRTTLAPAQILGVDDQIGTFAPGMPMSFIEVALPEGAAPQTAAEAILAMLGNPAPSSRVRTAVQELGANGLPHGDLLQHLTDDVWTTAARLANTVRRVVLNGEQVRR